jgi:carboxylate-amine ligase
MLLDPDTLELTQAIEPVLARDGESGRRKPELLQCQVEIATPPCRTAAEALAELTALRGRLVRDAELCGVRVAAAGTHPFSPVEDQRITARDRYREMVAALRYPARHVVTFGMHVHVAVGGGPKALQVLEAILPDLPLLLALSTSSPFLHGEETGLASTRLVLGQAMPRTGLPPPFESYDDYLGSLSRLQRAGALADSTFCWWDARLHPTFGTIEIRIMDVQPCVEDSAAIAGLVQALVRSYGKRYDRGGGFPRANRLVVAENRWLAARHGLRAPLVHDGEDAVPARELVGTLLERVEADASTLGAAWALEHVSALTGRGSSAERQLRLHRGGAVLPDVVRELCAETSGA